ncbi:MAG: MoaD/ThiS family protein [Thermoplasmata archaeon]
MSGGESRIQVLLPRVLLEYSNGEESVDLVARTLAEAIEQLDARFPGLGERILDDQGHVRRFVHVFVNQDSVGSLEPVEVQLRSGDTVHILPSVAGG